MNIASKWSLIETLNEEILESLRRMVGGYFRLGENDEPIKDVVLALDAGTDLGDDKVLKTVDYMGNIRWLTVWQVDRLLAVGDADYVRDRLNLTDESPLIRFNRAYVVDAT